MGNVVKMKPGETMPEVTDTGVTGLDKVSEDTFFECGKQLAKINHGLQWAIGDWYNNIPAGKGNQYSGEAGKKKACEQVGLNYHSAETYGAVARKFATQIRIREATFKHHQFVAHADLKDEDAVRLLNMAVHQKWSPARVKEERNKLLGIFQAKPESIDEDLDMVKEEVIKAMPKDTPKRAVKAAVKGVEEIAGKLRKEFVKQVEAEATKKSQEQRDQLRELKKEAQTEYDRAINMKAGVKAFITKEEFMLVRSCLHPDRECDPVKKAEAFKIFNKLAEVKDW